MTPAEEPQKPYRITIRYLLAVAFIYACTSIAWLFLGAVTESRTHQRDHELRNEIGQIWGGEHHQVPPQVWLAAVKPTPPEETTSAEGENQSEINNAEKTKNVRKVTREKIQRQSKNKTQEEAPRPPASPAVPKPCQTKAMLEPIATNAVAELDLEHRRKGLLWYSTYRVKFDGAFTVHNDSPCKRQATVWVPFPSDGATYDEFSLHMGGEEVAFDVANDPANPDMARTGAMTKVTLAPGAKATVGVRYTSRGLDSWAYSFGSRTARAKNFQLVVKTNFDKFDFPGGSLAPSSKEQTDGGWALAWSFRNLLADASIKVAMPQKLNPGPMTTEISRFAPVSLFFFFFVLLLVSVVKQVRLHPVHYGMLAAAFFSFHLLTAYLVDHVSMYQAITVASVTSVGLVVSYLRLAVGGKFAVLWAGGAQMLYLVLFSLAFFAKGYTGLTITIFSVLTLFLVMQLTGRIDWSTKFGSPPPPPQPQPQPQYRQYPEQAIPYGGPAFVPQTAGVVVATRVE